MAGQQQPPPVPVPWAAPVAPAAPSIQPAPMTAAASGKSYTDFKAYGWTDEQLVEHGYMEPFPMFPTPEKPARSLAVIQTELDERTEAARAANDVADNARNALRATRDEFKAACAYFTHEANKQLVE